MINGVGVFEDSISVWNFSTSAGNIFLSAGGRINQYRGQYLYLVVRLRTRLHPCYPRSGTLARLLLRSTPGYLSKPLLNVKLQSILQQLTTFFMLVCVRFFVRLHCPTMDLWTVFCGNGLLLFWKTSVSDKTSAVFFIL